VTVLLSALPEPVIVALLEQGGPTALVIGALWYRMNRLEERLQGRVESLEEDVSANSGVIYDHLLNGSERLEARSDGGERG
jgi:hypothetical protein